jgi:hypothetical protein
MNNYMKNFYTPFVFKDYHINIGGPNANHIRASMIYEDALPPSNVYSSYKTLKERNSLCQYIRGTFINIEEGEDANFKGGPNSINSRLKLIELNPYNTNYFSSNPYKGLPKNMLIYRSCYPIMYDKKESTTQCQKSSVGINMRVYRLTKEEYQVYKPTIQGPIKPNETRAVLEDIETKKKTTIQILEDITQKAKYMQTITPITDKTKIDFDVWREIAYYEYIRNNINKNLVCPNFVESYCYFINDDSELSFTKNTMNENGDMYDPALDSKKSIILLTESPNMNIYTWASDAYIKEYNIQKQIYTGYKPENVWEVVIFQMLVVFYAMDKYNITYTDMKLQNNFYIKDINVYGDSSQCWKYRINNIDYYVPNFGHLLMFDSDYHDIDTMYKQKTLASFLKNKETIIKEQIRRNAITCLNSNNFGQEFKNSGGSRPSETILKLLETINQDLRTGLSYEKIIQNNFIKFLHNRIGTPLRQLEIGNIKRMDVSPFRKGQLVVWEKSYDNYEIVIYLDNKDEYNCNCATKENNLYIIKEISKDLIFHYSDYEIIQQDAKPNEAYMNMDYILETYNL